MSGIADAAGSGLVLPWTGIVADGGLAVALVRHGRTAWNHERRFLGTTDIPLDPVGHEQARTLARRIGRPFHRVYSSPLARAHETASHLEAAPVAVHDLHELHQGELEGLQATEAIARFPGFFAAWAEDPTTARAPGGESLGECRDRAMAALERLAAEHEGGQVVAAVTHQMVIASLTCTILGEELTCWRDHGVGNACVTVLARDEHGWSVVARGWEGCDPVADGAAAALTRGAGSGQTGV